MTHPECEWTYWINVDTPLSGDGDLETLSKIRSIHSFCSAPVQIECRDAETKVASTQGGQRVSCDIKSGFKCLNWENGGHCRDYEARFYCPCASKQIKNLWSPE